MTKTVDLDALLPESTTIKFGGQEIEVKPPKTGQVLRLGKLGERIQDVEKLSSEEVDKLVTDITSLISEIIPELTGKDLSTAQLLTLIQIIGNMSIPPDAKELKEKGISPASPKVPQG
jgi:hypothetical protein